MSDNEQNDAGGGSDLPDNIRDTIIMAIKVVLKRTRRDGLFDGEEEYDDLLSVPERLAKFIEVYQDNRDLGKDLAVDKSGAAVMDDETPLVCGVTLAEIERSLLYSCAKRVFAKQAGLVDADGTRRVQTRMLAATKPRLLYHWQWPMIEVYAKELRPEHMEALGDDLLKIESNYTIWLLGQTTGDAINRARDVAGRDFDMVLQVHPTAIASLAACDERHLDNLKKLTGTRIWEFLARDRKLVAELARAPADRVQALAPWIADLCFNTYGVLKDLPAATLTMLMQGYDKTFGRPGRKLLTDEEFARKFLHDVVGALRKIDPNTETGKEQIGETVGFKLNALRPKVAGWVRTKGIT